MVGWLDYLMEFWKMQAEILPLLPKAPFLTRVPKIFIFNYCSLGGGYLTQWSWTNLWSRYFGCLSTGPG